MENPAELAIDKVKEYALGGNALLIVKNEKTGKHMRFKINTSPVYPDQWSVIAISPTEFVGVILSNFKFVMYQPDRAGGYVLKAAFKAIWQRVLRPDLCEPTLKFYHDGRCGVCRRPLTDLTSIQLGIGPICAGRKK